MNEAKFSENTSETDPLIAHKERRWVMIRLVLGITQIIGVIISLVQLIRIGVNTLHGGSR